MIAWFGKKIKKLWKSDRKIYFRFVEVYGFPASLYFITPDLKKISTILGLNFVVLRPTIIALVTKIPQIRLIPSTKKISIKPPCFSN